MQALSAASMATPVPLYQCVFRGDVNTLVGKSLEKDRSRRYQTALDFAADIRRYLTDEPLSARPAGAVYQLRKFARRNRLLVGSATVVLLVLIAASTISTVFAIRASRGEAAAIRAGQQESRERARAERITRFYQDMLEAPAPGTMRGENFTVAEVLDEAALRVAGELADSPVVEYAVRLSISRTYRALGRFSDAEDHARVSLEIAERAFGHDHPDTLVAMANPDQFEEAETLALETVDRSRSAFGAQHQQTASALEALSHLQTRAGRWQDALPLHRQALAIYEAVHGDDHPSTLFAANNLALVLRTLGQLEEAESMYRRTLTGLRRVLGDEHLDTLVCMNNLAVVLRHLDRPDEAEAMCRECLATSIRVLGEGHQHSIKSLGNLGLLLKRQNRLDEAESFLVRAIELYREVYGPEYSGTLTPMANPARLYQTQGRMDRAEAAYLQLIESGERILPPDHRNLGIFYAYYGNFLVLEQRYEEAEPVCLQANTVLAAALGEEHPRTVASIDVLVQLYEEWGRSEDAARWRAMLPSPP
ncbi:MAG: tetratricopeptide repeat protein [Planctomycetota bacterium]|jgi:tetratricopeptide (TPR) repeat protein